MAAKIIRVFVNTVIAIAVIGVGVLGAKSFIANKEEPERVVKENKGEIVEIIKVSQGEHKIVVNSSGNVIPSRQGGIRPQVNGRIVWLNDSMIQGGFVKDGDLLLKIEKKDYELNVSERKTSVEQAEAQLALEKGREEVAKREWEMFESVIKKKTGELKDEHRGLATRVPQIKSAKANKKAAKNRLSKAKLDLSRTKIKAPFDAMIKSESVEVGDIVGANSLIATLIGTNTVWIKALVPVNQLILINIPGPNSKQKTQGASVKVIQDTGGEPFERSGKVVRLLGDLDPVGRMAQLIIEVENPFGTDNGKIPLLLDSYVSLEIDVTDPVKGIEIPRYALREGDRVFVMNSENLLEIRTVSIAWRFEKTVVVDTGLEDGDRVITSRLGSPLNGMKLRILDSEEAETTDKEEPSEKDGAQSKSEEGTNG